MCTVKDLSPEELKALISEVAEEELREVLANVDAGLATRPEQSRRDGENIPTAEQPRRRRLECVVLVVG
jgi:hypothetical protein